MSIVATSTPQKLVENNRIRGNNSYGQHGQEPVRLQAINSSNVLTSATAKYLTQHFGDFTQIKTQAQLDFTINAKKQFLEVTPLKDGRGIDWLIVVVVPESDFMERIQANTRTTILLCISALVGSTVVGLLTSRWIIRPIWRLNTAAKDIASGKWERKVEVEHCSAEIGQLAKSFKSMAAQLQDSFAILKTQNEALRESEKKLGLIYQLVDSFDLSEKFNFRSWWRNFDFLLPGQRLRELIAKVLLDKIPKKIVIFIDEIDSILRLNFNTDNFFALIRYFYNERADHPKYNRLTFVLLGVASPSSLIQDKNYTPFNIGTAIALEPFMFDEVVKSLAQGLVGRCSNPQTMLKEVLTWTGGQPFLTQKICHLILNSQVPKTEEKEAEWLEKLVQTQVIENWEFKDNPEHLKTIRNRLLSRKSSSRQLLELYQQILHKREIPADDSPETMELLLSGLVRCSQGKLRVYNRIYEAVFNNSWVAKNLENQKPM